MCHLFSTIVKGVPSTIAFTEPEITTMSPSLYADLSVDAVIRGSATWPKLGIILDNKIVSVINSKKFRIEKMILGRIFPLLWINTKK